MPPTKQQTREEFIESLFKLEKQDNICSGNELKDKLINGINKVVDVVKTSYGPTGSNCILEADLYPFHRATNDGKLIAESIKLADPVENIGANLVKEVANKSDKESGDGRKTTMILLQAILKEGVKYVEDPTGTGTDPTGTGIDPMTIKRLLDECLPIILKSIDEQTRQITVGDVSNIARIASESEFLGRMYGEIYAKIGKDGIVEIDNSGVPDTFYEITEGVRLLNCGFQYAYMANEDRGRKAIYNFPKVLITREKISNAGVLDKILKNCYEHGLTELVIFCDEIDPIVSQSLAFLHNGVDINGRPITPFKTLVIKAPVLWKDWLFEDFAKITGATIVNPTEGRTLKNFQYNWLGYCDKIITSKDETIVLGIRDIAEHIKVLEDLNTDDAKIRIARLKTKTAILKVGANSETELSYIKGKAIDARNSSYLALNGGIVQGAGIGLEICSTKMSDTIGGKILKEALLKPFFQIQDNMNLPIGSKYAMENSIFDPAIVIKNAITNALSVASTVLTTKTAITLRK